MSDSDTTLEVARTPQLPPIGVFSSGLDNVPIARAQHIVAELESLGYGALFFPDSGERESLVKSSLFLGATEHLIVATGIASIWTRRARIAQGASKALCDAFPGRFLLGLGTSHRQTVEGALGLSYDHPVEAMGEYLDQIDELALASSGRTRAPRVLAALGPRMLELAAQRSDGAHPYLVTPEHTAIARKILGPDKILAVEQAVTLSVDKEVTRSRARAHLNNYLRMPNYQNSWLRLGYDRGDFADGGSDRLVDALVVGGRDEEILARVLQHLDAGASHVCIQAIGDNARELPRDQWRALAPGFAELTLNQVRR